MKTYYDKFLNENIAQDSLTVAGSLFWAGVTIGAIHALWHRFLSAAARKCNHLSGVKKTHCMNMEESVFYREFNKTMNDEFKKCEKSKNPQLCRDRITKGVNDVKKSLKKNRQ